MPGSPLYLLDSSVIAKWFVQEDDSDKALEIRDLFIQKKHRVSTISLLRYELGNLLWKHPAKRIESVREDFESLSEMAILTLDIDDPKVLTRVFEPARSLEITFHDASYLTTTGEGRLSDSAATRSDDVSPALTLPPSYAEPRAESPQTEHSNSSKSDRCTG